MWFAISIEFNLFLLVMNVEFADRGPKIVIRCIELKVLKVEKTVSIKITAIFPFCLSQHLILR
jgi:hypothetical protein